VHLLTLHQKAKFKKYDYFSFVSKSNTVGAP